MTRKCLLCQKRLSDADPYGPYHSKCSRRLFGTTKPPEVPFASTDIASEARKMVGKMSISGVQPKLSVIHERTSHELKVVERGGLYILKPPSASFESLPENENLCMLIAGVCDMEAPAHGLIPLKDDKLAYVVKRFDRQEDGSKRQQEDFQQLLETDDKYSGSYERMARLIKKHSATPGLDLVGVFERALLFFVLGNGDAHLKNFSLLRKEQVGYGLSPVYDIVNSRLVLPGEREEMCLSLNGKKNKVTKEDFIALAQHFGLSGKQVDNAMGHLEALQPTIENLIEESLLRESLRLSFLEIFRERAGRLFV